MLISFFRIQGRTFRPEMGRKVRPGVLLLRLDNFNRNYFSPALSPSHPFVNRISYTVK